MIEKIAITRAKNYRRNRKCQKNLKMLEMIETTIKAKNCRKDRKFQKSQKILERLKNT